MSRALAYAGSPVRVRSTTLIVVASAALGATTTNARADGSESGPPIAQSLFDDGRTLMGAGRHSEACRKFADSHHLEPAGGTLLNLALCHELEGKTATAWSEFRDALSIAIRDTRADRQELAELHIAALGPKLTRVAVVVPGGVAARAPEVTFDRSPLPSAAWNTAIPVDPGEHRIAVTAQGLRRWETALMATEEGRTYSVEVPGTESLAGAPCLPGATHEGRACDGAALHRGHRRSTAFWVLMGGAGVSVATSVVTGVMALDANAHVKDNCSSERAFCRVDDAKDEASRARAMAWVSTVALLVGAGAAVVALVLPVGQTSPMAASAGVRIQNGATFATFELMPRRW